MRFPCSEGSLVELLSESVASLNAVLSEAVPPLLDWFPMVVNDLHSWIADCGVSMIRIVRERQLYTIY
jgi:hypothetical protein